MHCKTEDFLGGDGKKLLLVAMPVFWRENGWFGVTFWRVACPITITYSVALSMY
jgi:hypothetical protein